MIALAHPYPTPVSSTLPDYVSPIVTSAATTKGNQKSPVK